MANQVMYGFHNLEHVFDKRVTEVGVEVVNEAIQSAVDFYNQQSQRMVNIFASPTTDFKVVHKVAASSRLQPLDEDGRARKIRHGEQYEVAFPIMSAGAAWGANYISRVKMTVEEANELTQQLVAADARWMRDQILAALFTNVDYTFDDPEHGALTIQPLADGDATEYLVVGGASPLATDTHHLAFTDMTDSEDVLVTVKDELLEHPQNTGDVLHFMPSGLITKATNLSLFVSRPDANIEYANRDNLVGSPGGDFPGELKGYVEDGGYVIEWNSLPANYVISIPTGGPRALAMRQHAESELQGFRRQAVREDHPFWESQYARYAGFGARSRVGAVVTYIDAGGSYAIPSGYQAPIT